MRAFKDGAYETWNDYYLGPHMIAGDRVSYMQYVTNMATMFKKHNIRHRMLRIRKWTHQYLRVYVHIDDLKKLNAIFDRRRIMNADAEGHQPRGITCIAGRL
jgi:hypothetical protein